MSLILNDSNEIKGSFVNLVITIIYMGLIGWSVFNADAAKNIGAMASVFIGFYMISFGVWKGTKTIETIFGKVDLTTGTITATQQTAQTSTTQINPASPPADS